MKHSKNSYFRMAMHFFGVHRHTESVHVSVGWLWELSDLFLGLLRICQWLPQMQCVDGSPFIRNPPFQEAHCNNSLHFVAFLFLEHSFLVKLSVIHLEMA